MKKKISRQSQGPIQKWGAKIDWKKRVRAVCKPCWEIKYCPYGPLVELMPMQDSPNDRSCKIFGHDCPVFYCAEPLTETKELRIISRAIPRPVQFRVLKRENQICSECGTSVKDEDIEFDHIIPWSKGGSSHESNVRLLCRQCNRKRGNRFEDKYLVNSLNEHIRESTPYEFVKIFIEITKLVNEFRIANCRIPNPEEFCRFFGKRKAREDDTFSVDLFKDINDFFMSKRPPELKAREFNALKYRWGFSDDVFHKLKDTSQYSGIDINRLLDLEIDFIRRLGFHIITNKSERVKWLSK
jgi:hypothetical protein